MTDYKDILLNECGDLKIDEGDLVLVSGADRVRQSWLIYIRTFLGEWFLNLNIGVPYFQRIFKKAITKVEVQRIINKATLEVPGVKQVNNVDVQEIDLATRSVEITVEAVIEGDETLTFKYSGSLPPEGCEIVAASDYPKTVGALFVWFDAQDLSNTIYVPGSSIVLNNKAGEGNATGEGSGSNIPALVGVTPLNNKRAIYFDNAGSNDEYLRFLNTRAIRHGSGAISIFIVVKPQDPGGVPFGRGLLSFDGFETVNYNREGYDIYEALPNPDSSLLFRPSPPSVLVDGSMEKSGVADWNAGNNAILTKENGSPFRDLQNLKVAYDGTASPYASQTVLTINKSYKVTGRMRGDGTFSPLIVWGAGAWQSTQGTPSTSWQFLNVNALAGYNAIAFASDATAAGFAEYDDLRIIDLIIVDGDCEAPTAAPYWSAFWGATLSKETTAPYEGTQCLRITNVGGIGAAVQSVVTIGKKYRIKGVARSDGAAVPSIKLLNTEWTGSTSTSWQHFDFVKVADSTSIWFTKSSGAGNYVEYDAIEIAEVESESIAPASAFDPMLLSFIRNASGDLEIWRDGVSLGVTTGVAERLLNGDGVIGALLSADFYTAEKYFHGYIGEVLIYEGEISGDNLTNLHNFLLNKWDF